MRNRILRPLLIALLLIVVVTGVYGLWPGLPWEETVKRIYFAALGAGAMAIVFYGSRHAEPEDAGDTHAGAIDGKENAWGSVIEPETPAERAMNDDYRAKHLATLTAGPLGSLGEEAPPLTAFGRITDASRATKHSLAGVATMAGDELLLVGTPPHRVYTGDEVRAKMGRGEPMPGGAQTFGFLPAAASAMAAPVHDSVIGEAPVATINLRSGPWDTLPCVTGRCRPGSGMYQGAAGCERCRALEVHLSEGPLGQAVRAMAPHVVGEPWELPDLRGESLVAKCVTGDGYDWRPSREAR